MRLSQDKVNAIIKAISDALGDDVTIRLFGSQLDHAVEGGDVDLYVEHKPNKEFFYFELLDKLGEITGTKVDLILHETGKKPPIFSKIAIASCVPLYGCEQTPEAGLEAMLADGRREIRDSLLALIGKHIERAKVCLTTHLDDRNYDSIYAIQIQDAMKYMVSLFRSEMALHGVFVRQVDIEGRLQWMKQHGVITDVSKWHFFIETMKEFNCYDGDLKIVRDALELIEDAFNKIKAPIEKDRNIE